MFLPLLPVTLSVQMSPTSALIFSLIGRFTPTTYNDLQVKLIGEGADDAGGVFDDTITEMCRELCDPASGLGLLIPTPNGRADSGLNRDKFVLNPDKASPADLRHYWFLGA